MHVQCICGDVCFRSREMSSSILDLSMSRGTAADTSSGPTGRSRTPFSQFHDDSVTAELRVSTTDHDQVDTQATSPDTAADDDFRAADANDKVKTISSLAVSGSLNDVSDDVGSRDHQQQIRHRPRDQNQAYQYLDYQAAAAAAARFLVPFPFSSPAAAATGSAPLSSSVPPLNFYPLSFPAMPPPPEAGLPFRPEGAAAAAAAAGTLGYAAGSPRSTADPGVTVKDDCSVTSPAAAGHVADPTYAERRRKNNEAARRSRDARRMKERETCLRAALLQQENVRLRAEMAVLKTEIARLHCLLYDKM